MDTFTITAFNRNTDTVTVTFVLQARTGFAGGTFAGQKLQGMPRDTVANVKSYFRTYVNGLIAGKQSEDTAQTDASVDVKALVNVATEF